MTNLSLFRLRSISNSSRGLLCNTGNATKPRIAASRRCFSAMILNPNSNNTTRSTGKLVSFASPSSTMFRAAASNNVGNTLYCHCFHSSSDLMMSYPPHTVFEMPALSPTMETGTISKWLKAEGDEFIAGDVLCSIDTDKASVDYEAQDDGILAKILRTGPTAEDIPCGTAICVVVEEMDDVAAFKDFSIDDVAASSAPAAAAAAPAAETSSPPPAASTGATAATRTVDSKYVLMPSARHLSESKGLDATGIEGTGKGGRVTKGDVLTAIQSGVVLPPLQKKAASATVAAAAPAAAAPVPAPAPAPKIVGDLPLPAIDLTNMTYEDVTNNKMRKVIASRLTESKRYVPHFYTSIEIELDEILSLRKQLLNVHEVKVSINDMIIKCVALALRDVPEVNSTYNEKTNTKSVQDTIDVSVAVATPTGLITPILFDTASLGLVEISESIKDLANRAKDGKLQPNEYQGGTFCVSNLGMFGINEFSAVINPPQGAILAVGGGTKRVISSTPYILDSDEPQQSPTIKTIMTGRLSADRRVVDEPTVGLFMAAFRHYMNQPKLCLL